MKLDRLRTRAAFKEIALVGHKVFMPHFIVQIQRISPPCKTLTVGITASRRVGNAVQRNTAKRRMRVLSQELRAHAFLGGTRIVLIAKPSLITASFADLLLDIHKSVKRVLHAMAEVKS